MMKLLKFRVTNFRSVEDSGWVDTDNVTALIGTNESGKTNLLIPLWKLHPAKDGQINALADYPRTLYGQFKDMDEKPVFIDAHFELSDDLAIKISELVDATQDDLRVVSVKRGFDGYYCINFPNISTPLEALTDDIQQLILNNLPFFVYYSNYGNLDSEIYLPHVIENLQRTDLGQHEQAKVRTLKVLFDFVKLKPQEILELGYDFDPRTGQNPNQDQVKVVAEKKKEREVLLQSASTQLTKNFQSWWKQGNYRFSFSADGNFFRIWVSDDKRPEQIELEGRSTGLQWFLSFYLVFLVESTDTHKDAILLLDEPGLSLHPLAQEDLSNFFESLSRSNQLIYTTHSPFMVDPDHLDRVKAVYVDANGKTVVSSNLRANERNPAQSHSIYPVHAALGLSVSTMLMQGCQSVLVEGTSDQLYLSAIKNYLISKGHITPKRELLFVPAGGVKGITAIAPILTAKDEALPFAILDSDRPGIDMANKLKTRFLIYE